MKKRFLSLLALLLGISLGTCIQADSQVAGVVSQPALEGPASPLLPKVTPGIVPANPSLSTILSPTFTPGQPYWCIVEGTTFTVGSGTIPGKNILGTWTSETAPFSADITSYEIISTGEQTLTPESITLVSYDTPQPATQGAGGDQSQKSSTPDPLSAPPTPPVTPIDESQGNSASATPAPLSPEQVKAGKDAFEREKKFSLQLDSLVKSGVDITDRGVAATGKLNIWKDKYVEMTFSLSSTGVYGRGYLTKLDLGPVVLTGAGPDGVYGTADDGVLAEFFMNEQYFSFLCSGRLEIIGCVAQADLAISTTGLSIHALGSLFGIFDLELVAKNSGTGPDQDFQFMAQLSNNLIDFLQNKAKKALTEGIKNAAVAQQKAKEDLNRLNDSINKELDVQIAATQKELAEAKEELSRKYEAAKKIFEPAKKHFEEQKAANEGKIKKINDLRNQLKKEREDAIKEIGKAQATVQKLYEEIERQRDIIRKERKVALDALQSAQNDVDKLNRQIDENRAAVQKERKAADDKLRGAQDNVNKLNQQIDDSRRRRKDEEGKVMVNVDLGLFSVDLPNPVAAAKVAAYWVEENSLIAAREVANGILEASRKVVAGFPVDADPRVAPIIAAREASTGILNAAKEAIKGFPIDADPRVAGIFVAYEPARQALLGAIEALKNIPIDADPRVIAAFAEYELVKQSLTLLLDHFDVIAAVGAGPYALPLALHVAALEGSILAYEGSKYSMQGFTKAASLTLDVTTKVTETAGVALGAALSEVTDAIAKGLEFFSITKAGLSFSAREVNAGKLPMVFLQLVIMKKEKNFTFQANLADPETFVKMFMDTIGTLFDNDNGGDDTFTKNFEALKKEAMQAQADLAKLAASRKAQAAEVASAKAHNDALAKVAEQQAAERAAIERAAPQKNEGEFGKAPIIPTPTGTNLQKSDAKI